MVELRPSPFLGPMARLPVMRVLVFFNDSKHAAGVCLGTIPTRTHVKLGLSCQQLLLKVQHKVRFTLQHVVTRRILETNADHVLFAWCRTRTFPQVGRITPLIPLILCYLQQPWRCFGKNA